MVFVSIITLFGLGLVAAILLSIASRVFYVKEDPRVEAVLEVLPGANCGGCGFAGCEGYARPWSPIPTSRPTNAAPAVPIRPSPWAS